MHFDISKYKGVSIASFDMEEMTGRDSMDAAARSAPPRAAPGEEPPPMSGFQLNILHRNQLIAQSISKVDGELVTRPFTKWENWTLRTQEFVITAYMRINEATKAEMDDFTKAHFDAPAAVSTPNSSGSGSGSSGTYAGPVYPSTNG